MAKAPRHTGEKLAAQTDGLLHCMMVHGHCIPLWPQYTVDNGSARFFKVAAYEAWMVELGSATRKDFAKGYEPATISGLISNKDALKAVCNSMLLEYRKVVTEAKLSLTSFASTVCKKTQHATIH